jgi:hypothetical protein
MVQQKATEAAAAVPVVKVMVLPPPPPPPLPPPISKAKKIAWVESQVKKDQQEAINPNYTTPFRGREDACKRLLRYHVFEVRVTNLLFCFALRKFYDTEPRCCAFQISPRSYTAFYGKIYYLYIACFEEVSVVYREQSKVAPFGGTIPVLVLI